MRKKWLNSVINFISKGNTVSIICDAGTPTLSDPGILGKKMYKK